MKRILIVMAGLMSLAYSSKAQFIVTDPGNVFQSIINATQIIMQGAETTDGILKNFQETVKIYQQSKEYYDKLNSVSSHVKNARRINECVGIVGDISNIYIRNYDRMLLDNNFSTQELKAIGNGYARILTETTNRLADLQSVVYPTDASMTDKERIDMINEIHSDLIAYRSLTNYYTRKNISVSILRSQEKADTEGVLSLYGDGSPVW